jgi:hypothetical protein
MTSSPTAIYRRAKNDANPISPYSESAEQIWRSSHSPIRGWSTIFESPTWLDSKEFKEYALKIAQILLASDRPLCTREIHAALGDDACPRRTQDALEAVRNLGKTGVLVTRYFIIPGDLAQPAKLDQDEEHDRIFEN